jgi:hypothetical protein
VPGVEVLEVRRGLPGQLLGLPLAQPGSGDTGDLRADLAERAARGQRRGLAAQPVRMLAPGQVQLRVRPVHIRRARRPVRDPGHRDRPEHRRQRPRVPRLGPGPGGPVRARHARLPLLPGSPQIQVILQQQPQHLPAPRLQVLLQHPVLQPRRLRPVQPPLDLRERLPRPRERRIRRVL